MKMKGIVLTGYRKVELQDIPKPEANGTDVLIKVARCGICGSDFHSYYDRGDLLKGRVLGHEYSGYVEDPGSRTDLKKGDRVTVCPATGCGHCELCLRGHSNLCGGGHEFHGAFAEYIMAAPHAVFKVPEILTMEEAAMMEPLATSVRGVRQAGVNPGTTVLVIGGGIIGATTAQMARVAGALTVVMGEAIMERVLPLKARGICDEVVDTTKEDALEALKAANGGALYDYVFECAGAGPAMAMALNAVKIGGTIGLIGANPADYPLNMRLPVIKEIRIQGSYAYDEVDFKHGMDLVCAGRLSVKEYSNRLIKLEDTPQMFEDLRTHKVNDYRVMVDVEHSFN